MDVTDHDASSTTLLSRCLNQAEKEPYLAIEKGWYLDPAFCLGFFDRCDQKAFVSAPETVPLAMRAVEMADRNGDPHLIHRSQGVLSHAFISAQDLHWAGKMVHGYRDAALACCPGCRSEVLRRQGDLLIEQQSPREALRALQDSLEEGGRALDADARSRIGFLHAIAFHLTRQREAALDTAGSTLQSLSLESPRGYFLDTVAFIGWFLVGGAAEHDAIALEHLRHFQARLAGQRGWANAHTLIRWVAGQIAARLDDSRRAQPLLEKAHGHLLEKGRAREAVAVTVDLAQLRCRHREPRAGNVRAALRDIEQCLKRQGLSRSHVKGLREMERILLRRPEAAYAELVAFRRSIVAPVPGLLGELQKPRRDLRLVCAHHSCDNENVE